MEIPLIILYGRISSNFHVKQQMMIDGHCTCGYRPYAKKYGEIIYLAKQNCRESWERDFSSFDFNIKKLVEYLNTKPDALIWALKYDQTRDVQILSKTNHKKIYYSCCANNTINEYCDVSLVDIKERLKNNARLWIKGKDPEYWYPISDKKEYDYLLIGRRADKNEVWFINELTRQIKEKRSILWIGGFEHLSKIDKSHHKINCTTFLSMIKVRDLICRAKIGILLSEHPAEGFPQSFLEMTMCGLPVVYCNEAPINHIYFSSLNSIIIQKHKGIDAGEYLLRNNNPEKCREYAINHYSLGESYQSILRAMNE